MMLVYVVLVFGACINGPVQDGRTSANLRSETRFSAGRRDVLAFAREPWVKHAQAQGNSHRRRAKAAAVGCWGPEQAWWAVCEFPHGFGLDTVHADVLEMLGMVVRFGVMFRDQDEIEEACSFG